MGQAVLVDEEDAVDRPPHTELVELVAHSLETRRYARVLLEERVFRAEGVVGQRIEVDLPVERERRIPRGLRRRRGRRRVVEARAG